MALVLRDFQADMRDRIRAGYRELGHRAICAQLATGGGKTAIAGAIAGGLAQNNHSMLVLVHRRELVDQWAKTLTEVGLGGRFGVIAANRAPSPWASMQIGAIQTLYRRPHLVLKPTIVVIDEAHHARAKTWEEVIARFPRARLLGLTATPTRLDGKPLSMFTYLVQGPSILWLVTHGYLAPTTLKYVPRGVLTKGVKRTGGEYNRGELGEQLNRAVIVSPVESYLRYARGRRAIFFGINTSDSEQVAELFRARGVRAAHVDGTTASIKRDRLIAEFREGHLDVLCNVDIVSEGTDIPQCNCVIMGMPTLSETRYLQQGGRGMRPDHGGDNMVIDTVGNFARHRAPDADREWTLGGFEPDEVKPKAPSANVRVCVHCATVYPARAGMCPTCGKAPALVTPKHLDVELLTREGDDEPVPLRKGNVMSEVRRELRTVIREGRGRAGIEDIAARHELGERWTRNAIEALAL